MHVKDRIKELRRVRASELRPNPRNWRTHPPEQQDALRGVLAEVGYADALIARETEDGGLELIDGHLRAETTPDAEVPVLVLDVSESEAAKILATLDPLSGMAGIDEGKLKDLLAGVSTQNEALAKMLDDLAKEAGAIDLTAITEDDPPAVLPEAVSRPGDLWVFPGADGEPWHRLLCGDSTRSEDVLRVMDGKLAALVATDPPYLVDYTGERPEGSGKDWSDAYREVEITDADGFFTSVFTNALTVMAPNTAIYCWHAHKRQRLIAEVWERLGILDHQQIIWVKPTPVFGRVFWHFQHEPCMMGWVQGSQPPHDSDHRFSSVWTIDWEGKSRVVGNQHPTQKPLELFARPMRKHTRKGDVCFEPFSGSGSQLVAAEQMGRRCYAIELEPRFVDVAVRRWQQVTGRSAVLEETGETWDEIAAEREVAEAGNDQSG